MKIGIIGPGKIAERFANACRSVENVTVYAVASSNRERAKRFADNHQIPHAFDRYEAVWQMQELDAVYIASINSQHYAAAKACLEAGKAVLCEKPMCVNLAQTKALLDTARQRGVLLMEAMWTATLPCIQQAAEWIRAGRIGAVSFLDCCFSFFYPKEEGGRLFVPQLGGGSLLDVGVYCMAFSLLMMGERPTSVKSCLQIGDTGVDEMGAALLQFEAGAVASCSFGVQGEAPADAHIYGSQGQIRMKEFYCCRRVELCDTAGQVVEVLEDSEEDGFVHEIRAFAHAFDTGKQEAKGASHQLTLDCAWLMEEIARGGANRSR